MQYIPHQDELGRIADRYRSLSPALTRRLTDFTNRLIVGINLIAYGNEDQVENGMEIFRLDMQQGRTPFPEFYAGHLCDQLTHVDMEHIRDMNATITRLNSAIASDSLTRENARGIKTALMYSCYGRATQLEQPNTTRGTQV